MGQFPFAFCLDCWQTVEVNPKGSVCWSCGGQSLLVQGAVQLLRNHSRREWEKKGEFDLPLQSGE